MKYEPHAHQDIRFTKKLKDTLKKTPFRRVPTAQKCSKKQYEIEIFVLHDQNLTKNNTHAPDANHDKGLAKTAENGRKNTVSTAAHGSKML